jgi:FtsZ-interacting cell division protein ZipA
LNCKKTKRVGEELIVIGITILLCTLFFVFFGTRLLIDTAYLEDTPQNDTTSVSDSVSTDNIEEETTTMSSVVNDNDSKSISVSIEDESTTKKIQEAQTKSTTTTQQSSISIPGVKSMKISKDSKTASVDLYNPSKNNCYFEISIILKDCNKQIYKSNLVRPGQHIYQIDLSQTLPKGEYTAVLHYDTYAMDDNYTELNGANIEFTLIVE